MKNILKRVIIFWSFFILVKYNSVYGYRLGDSHPESQAKDSSLSFISEYHLVSLDKYLKAKKSGFNYIINNILNNASGAGVKTGSYKITAPDAFLNYGIQYSWMTKRITLFSRVMWASSSGKDTLSWSDNLKNTGNCILDWEFHITDIGGGIGYTTDRTTILGKERDTIGILVGNYSVKLEETGRLIGDFRPSGGGIIIDSADDTYSGNKIYYEFLWLGNLYLSKEENVSLNGSINYKIVSLKKLDYEDINEQNVKFDFSGFKFGLGLSYWFVSWQ